MDKLIDLTGLSRAVNNIKDWCKDEISTKANKENISSLMGYQKYVGKLTSEQATMTFSSTSNNVLLKYTMVGSGRDSVKELLAGESFTIGGVSGPPVTLRFDADGMNRYVLSASSTTFLNNYNIRVYADLFILESVREMSTNNPILKSTGVGSAIQAKEVETFVDENRDSLTSGQDIPTEASGNHSVVLNGKSNASAKRAFAHGNRTIAQGENSHTEGHCTQVLNVSEVLNGYAAHAEGYGTLAYGTYSHVEGNRCKTYGANSHAEGYLSVSMKEVAHAEGYGTYAEAPASHTEGNNTKTSKAYSHAEGRRTETIGEASHTEGNETITEGDYAHAEGWMTRAKGAYSHTEGQYTFTHADAAHSEGNNTHAQAPFSHTEGIGTKSNPNIQGQHVEGYFNAESDGVKVIGCGTSDDDRKNAVDVKQDGRVFVKGLGNYDGVDSDNASDLKSVIDNKANSGDVYNKTELDNHLKSDFVQKVEVATINGQSIINGGNIEIKGGEGGANGGAELVEFIYLFGQELSEEQKSTNAASYAKMASGGNYIPYVKTNEGINVSVSLWGIEDGVLLLPIESGVLPLLGMSKILICIDATGQIQVEPLLIDTNVLFEEEFASYDTLREKAVSIVGENGINLSPIRVIGAGDFGWVDEIIVQDDYVNLIYTTDYGVKYLIMGYGGSEKGVNKSIIAGGTIYLNVTDPTSQEAKNNKMVSLFYDMPHTFKIKVVNEDTDWYYTPLMIKSGAVVIFRNDTMEGWLLNSDGTTTLSK